MTPTADGIAHAYNSSAATTETADFNGPVAADTSASGSGVMKTRKNSGNQSNLNAAPENAGSGPSEPEFGTGLKHERTETYPGHTHKPDKQSGPNPHQGLEEIQPKQRCEKKSQRLTARMMGPCPCSSVLQTVRASSCTLVHTSPRIQEKQSPKDPIH